MKMFERFVFVKSKFLVQRTLLVRLSGAPSELLLFFFPAKL